MPIRTHPMVGVISSPSSKTLQVGNDQEKAQSERIPRREKTKLTIRYEYIENISLTERAAISQ